MKAARIHRFGGPDVIALEDVPAPEPGPGELRIRIHASSVNPVDYKTREGGFLPKDKLPMTLGRDAAGVVDRLGPGADGGVRQGDAVFAMLDQAHGGNAEYALAKPGICAAMAPGIEMTTAGSLGLAALTAWQGLFDHGGLRTGQRVLIHGAAGGVGHLAVQFARARGAEVIATCSGEDADFVRGCGARVAIDYKQQRFEDHARDVDLVLDLIGGETQDRSWSTLKDGGILVSTLSEPETGKAGGRRVRGTHFMAQPNGAQLRDVMGLVESGEVRPFINRTLPLDAVAEAHRTLEHEHVRGKIVLTIN